MNVVIDFEYGSPVKIVGEHCVCCDTALLWKRLVNIVIDFEYGPLVKKVGKCL